MTPGKSLVYHFNDAGNAISVNDGIGYGCFAGYNASLPLNHPEFVSRMQRSVDNYLRNHRFKTAGSGRPTGLSGNVLRVYGKDATEKLYTQTFISSGGEGD